MPVVPATPITPPSTGTCLASKWLCVDGIEIANACRTLAYVKNLGHPLVRTSGLCCCDVSEFFTPATDDAPWYDPAIPESNDVLGVWLEELSTAPPYARTMRPRQWGGTLSAVRWGPREIHLVGWVYTKSAQGTEYARQWLFEALSATDGGCALPDVILFRGDVTADVDRHERTARRVGLVDYKDDVEPEFNQCWGFKFDATLSAETPFLYGRPIDVFDGDTIDPLSPSGECNVCNPCPVPHPEPCQCGPMTDPVREVSDSSFDDAYCRPTMVRRKFVYIPPTPYWQTATSIITVRTGTLATLAGRKGLMNLRIAAYQNPFGLNTTLLDDADYRNYFLCQDPCATVEVSCMPYAAELVIDGTIRSATVNCGGAVGSGYPYLSSNSGGAFQWPEFGCTGLMLVLETDYFNTPYDTTLRVQYVPRDRR